MQAQVQNQDASCIICREGITNPICPECIAKEVIHWKPELRGYLDTPVSRGETHCIFCGKSMSICAHCYSMDIFDLVLENYPEEAADFIETFDFGLKEELI